jgi:acyl transferase domain-containing protein
MRAMPSKPLVTRPLCPPAAEPSCQLLPLSGFSLAHLKLYATRLCAYLRARPHARLVDVCGTMALRRSTFPFRKAFVASSTQDLAEQLEAFAATGGAEAVGEAKSLRTAFVLTGQGAQWARNGVDLMHAFPTYRHAAMVRSHVDPLSVEGVGLYKDFHWMQHVWDRLSPCVSSSGCT